METVTRAKLRIKGRNVANKTGDRSLLHVTSIRSGGRLVGKGRLKRMRRRT